ncbi:tetrathionate reductase family octaheme c-type cytochrome [Thiorhodospira sibirica]|uniref:tetrathionate reductase family octaheme c-type cytochrome n=1 Tax=Thiorhodospira sibirica TaxID=154347 RepID=UPI001FE98D1B|nr:tetrathionate reductase family octaheme c-type cytochrome [Thiorhodospira sibirica]
MMIYSTNACIHRRWLFAVLLFFIMMLPLAAQALAQSTADHRKFEQLQGPFASGPEVTQACLSCHTEAALQVHQSIHWTWSFDHPATGQRLGKRHALNNLCLGLANNYPRCTSCHIGYGFADASFDLTAQDKVDCLICHDTTGTYFKFPTGAGHPPYEDTLFRGKRLQAPDLAHVAQHVGPSSRQSCGACHFEGGGGDAIKHGDLDSSLIAPPVSVDVHMSPDSLNFSCSTCHEFTGHIQEGSRYLLRARPTAGIAVPGRDNERPACESCHGVAPHVPGIHNKLNEHARIIACQTCHIPEIARGGLPTKTRWDWSTAGQRDAQGRPINEMQEGRVYYDGMKGHFSWDQAYAPDYFWFDGSMRYTLLDEPIDPQHVVDVNYPLGDFASPDVRIWPFKIMYGRQPFDAVNQTLVVAQLFGSDPNAYWQGYDWVRAIDSGMREAKALGQVRHAFSGTYGFVETRTYWPASHMVAPAADALPCEACHQRNGRLSGLPGVYIPGQHRYALISTVGWFLVFVSLLGVILHGTMRYILHVRKQRSTGGV